MQKENSLPAEVLLKITGDGSHTLFVPALNEHYHSVFGALTESEHIFIRAGLLSLPEKKKEIEVLEVGFGTGLNALLSCVYAEAQNLFIRYASLEKFPLPIEISSQFNFPNAMSSHFEITSGDVTDVFQKIHQSPWDEWVEITAHFHLKKIWIDLAGFIPEKETFDLVFFDAFGPDVQPEMWTEGVFSKIGNGMKPGALLVTYSTKGSVKRNLKNAGFSIAKLPGPPGKREILQAVKWPVSI